MPTCPPASSSAYPMGGFPQAYSGNVAGHCTQAECAGSFAGPSMMPPCPPASASAYPMGGVDVCREGLCALSMEICDVCCTRQVLWTSSSSQESWTGQARSMLRTVELLNNLPAYNIPSVVLVGTFSELCQSARYDPSAGYGAPEEADVGNRVGSAFVLAALLPEVFGIPNSAPWRSIGYPTRPDLRRLTMAARPPSGRGVDNMRMNVLETLLNAWQHNPEVAEVRDALSESLIDLRLAMDVVDPDRVHPPWMIVRRALQTPVMRPLHQRPRGMHGHV